MQTQSDFEMVDLYIVRLQESLSTGIEQQGQLNEIMIRSGELIDHCTSSSSKSAIMLVTDIRDLLRLYASSAADMRKSDVDLLRLACDWLIQLSTLHKEGLPEPSSLLREVRQLFVLSMASFSVSHNAGDSSSADIFADDSFFDSPPEMQGLSDPFGEDPGLSSGLERLQRAVTYVKSAVSSRRQVSDPFSGDPVAIADNVSIFGSFETDQGGEAATDIFSDDPALELD